MELILVGGILFAVVVLFLVYRRTRKSDLSILPSQFIVADIETTGLDPTKHEIIEIGAILVNTHSNEHTTFNGLVKPKRKVSKKITRITGITQDMLDKDGEPLDEMMDQFLDFIGQHRLVFFNAPFDMGFLKKAASRIIDNPVSCALVMSRRAWPGRKSYRLSELAKDGRLSTKGAHRAMQDCEMTMVVYAAAAKKLNSLE